MFDFMRDRQLWIDGRLTQCHRMEMTVENETADYGKPVIEQRLVRQNLTFTFQTSDVDFIAGANAAHARAVHIKDVSEDCPRTDCRFGAYVKVVDHPPTEYDSSVWTIMMSVLTSVTMKDRGVSLDHLTEERDIALRNLQRAQQAYDKATRAHAIKEHQVSLDEDLR